MWLLFHHKKKAKVVRGGETFRQVCPDCGVLATFQEVELQERSGLFMVDVESSRSRAYLCGACEELFDAREDGAGGGEAAPAPAHDWDKVERLAAEQRARDEARAQQEVRIDDELAELKRRLGK